MPDVSVVDYYAILHLPPEADLTGVENAYARLSDEFASMTDVDETCTDALRKVNEAYSVLSRPELRREYDAVRFARERAEFERRLRRLEQRRAWMQRIIVGALGVIVLTQAAVLIYLGHHEISGLLGSALGPLWPGGAG